MKKGARPLRTPPLQRAGGHLFAMSTPARLAACVTLACATMALTLFTLHSKGWGAAHGNLLTPSAATVSAETLATQRSVIPLPCHIGAHHHGIVCAVGVQMGFSLTAARFAGTAELHT
jgi:hypothetical protein